MALLRLAYAQLTFDFRKLFNLSLTEAVAGSLPVAELVALVLEVLASPGSATARLINEGEDPWGRLEQLTAHLFHALTGQPHPALPKPVKSDSPERRRALRDARERAAARRAAIDSGQLL